MTPDQTIDCTIGHTRWSPRSSAQDRDGARDITVTLHTANPAILGIGADSGSAGTFVTWAEVALGLEVDSVRKQQGQRRLAVRPRRWIVASAFTWITTCRRPDPDYDNERLLATAEAMAPSAMPAPNRPRRQSCGRRRLGAGINSAAGDPRTSNPHA